MAIRQMTTRGALNLRRLIRDRVRERARTVGGVCKCNCGYTCGRKCGLPVDQCIEQHYVRDCEHDWLGDAVDMSVTCFKCGMLAIAHDMRFGP